MFAATHVNLTYWNDDGDVNPCSAVVLCKEQTNGLEIGFLLLADVPGEKRDGDLESCVLHGHRESEAPRLMGESSFGDL